MNTFQPTVRANAGCNNATTLLGDDKWLSPVDTDGLHPHEKPEDVTSRKV